MVIFMHNEIFMELCAVFQLPQAVCVFCFVVYRELTCLDYFVV